MPEPKLKDKTRIKICLLLKLSNQYVNEEEATPKLNLVKKKTELHKNIANLLNQYVKEEEVTPGCVAAIHKQLKAGNKTPYVKDEWQLCLSKSVFEFIVEENKPAQEKLLDLATRSEINIKMDFEKDVQIEIDENSSLECPGLTEFEKKIIAIKPGNRKNRPVLLLGVMDLIAKGMIIANQIEPTIELLETFMKYWDKVGEKTKIREAPFVRPFFQLRKDSFWQLHPDTDKYYRLYEKLCESVSYAEIENDEFQLLKKKNCRDELRRVVLKFGCFSENDLQKIIPIVNESDYPFQIRSPQPR